MKKNIFIKTVRQWHRLLLWPALLALFIFGISGLTHPLLAWTGPQAARNMPPRTQFDAATVAGIPAILQRHDIAQAAIIKLVPTAQGNLLQVTTDPAVPRRYFDPSTREEMTGYDRTQAIWLARYYSGREFADILALDFQTTFSADYPPVNRLLPVYRLRFAGDDELTVYVHTETGALADINDHYKRNVQQVFQQLHTFRFLDITGYGRVILMLMLLSSLLGATTAGVSLLYGVTRRRIPRSGRRWHRWLAHAVWLPLFCFTASGIYHLLYQHMAGNARGLQLAPPLSLAQDRLSADFAWLDALQGQALNSISLVATPAGALYYRTSFPAADDRQPVASRNQRFDGLPTEKPALYVNASTGQPDGMDDAHYTQTLAMQFLQADAALLDAGKIVTHFGPDYDFRNKRLPAWQFTVHNASSDYVFIDPVTGSLIDRVPQAARLESLSFSMLHKWNFLGRSIGREKRDMLVVLVLSLTMVLAVLGFRLRRHDAASIVIQRTPQIQ